MHAGGIPGRAGRGEKRSYGTGALRIRRDARGRETWYGQWRAGGSLVKRKIGPKRGVGTTSGLTKTQAERELRKLIDAHVSGPPRERRTVADVGATYLEHLSAVGRKRSTLMDYESTLRVHLAPFFGSKPLQRIDPVDLREFMALKARQGRAPKSVRNYLGLLHSIFAFAQTRDWATDNPCKRVEKPRAEDSDPDIRFLEAPELEALLRETTEDPLGSADHALYLTAAMTGLRQGELLALRWRDVDWPSGRLRVRRSFVRGEFGSPKSRCSSRAVPLADRVATELEAHFQRSSYQGDDDLVFGHPDLGKPLDRSKLLKRFKETARRAAIREVRFHDLRHTFGTRMAAAGVPMRTLQEWMGHRDFKTTLIYADYAPSAHERELVERAFGQGINLRINLSETALNSDALNLYEHGKPDSAPTP